MKQISFRVTSIFFLRASNSSEADGIETSGISSEAMSALQNISIAINDLVNVPSDALNMSDQFKASHDRRQMVSEAIDYLGNASMAAQNLMDQFESINASNDEIRQHVPKNNPSLDDVKETVKNITLRFMPISGTKTNNQSQYSAGLKMEPLNQFKMLDLIDQSPSLPLNQIKRQEPAGLRPELFNQLKEALDLMGPSASLPIGQEENLSQYVASLEPDELNRLKTLLDLMGPSSSWSNDEMIPSNLDGIKAMIDNTSPYGDAYQDFVEQMNEQYGLTDLDQKVEIMKRFPRCPSCTDKWSVCFECNQPVEILEKGIETVKTSNLSLAVGGRSFCSDKMRPSRHPVQ